MATEHEFSLDEIKASAHRLVKAGQDVRNRINELTLTALARRDLAEQQVREVLAAITEGVALGAAERAEEVRSALTDALGGMDAALGHAAEAMHLALGEAHGRAQEFAEQDVKQGWQELKDLERIFLEVMSRVAQGATGLVRTEMTTLLEHARVTGTGTGERVRGAAEELANRLRGTRDAVGATGRRAALEIGSRVATLASRKLSEIAERIAKKAEALKPK